MEAKTGMIVRSVSGHDKGRFMVIISMEKGFVYLVDGKERKLDSPKKKNEKHIRMTNTVVDTDNLTDKRLREILREYTEQSIS